MNLDDFFVCFHDDNNNCNCRKPKTGLFIEASKKWDIDFKKSFMIGDRWKDIQAGQTIGCKTIFIDYNYNEINNFRPNFTTKDLFEATKIIEKFF